MVRGWCWEGVGVVRGGAGSGGAGRVGSGGVGRAWEWWCWESVGVVGVVLRKWC